MTWRPTSHPPNSKPCFPPTPMADRGEPTDAHKLRYTRSEAVNQHCQRPFQARGRRNHQLQVKVQLPRPMRRPSLQRQPRQPVESRILRRHGTRARPSELVKVCDEVVRSAGVHGSTFTDPRSKSIKSDHHLSSAHRADLHLYSTAVALSHIHLMHTSKHGQRCRSRAAVPQP